MKLHKFVTCIALIATGIVAGTVLAQARTFNVDRTDDDAEAMTCDDATPNDCSLRGAIRAANANPGADIINVPAGTYTLTIPGRAEDAAATGDLDITDDLTIKGAAADVTIIDGNDLDRVFHVYPFGANLTVTISGVTVQNGRTLGISFVDSRGGGILLGIANTAGGTIPIPNSSLTLIDCIVSDNTASNFGGDTFGGGIANKGGILTLRRTAVTGNNGQRGGGIVNEGQLSVDASTVASNFAGEGGGILSFGGQVTLTNSTISDNTATGSAGGIDILGGTLGVVNSTISGNLTDFGGGGIIIQSQAVGSYIRNSTITNNAAVENTPGHEHGHFGGGIAGGPLTLSNSIVAGNSGGPGPDCFGQLISGGYNLVGNSDGCNFIASTGDHVGTAASPIDPKLGPLGNNGGPTHTHALLPESPAIDAGNPAGCFGFEGAPLATDQRGEPRIADGNGDGTAHCDIGAYELVGPLIFAVSGVAPDKAGNAGIVLTFIYGKGFVSGATAKLTRPGEPDIVGNPVTVGDTRTVIAAAFDLTGRTAGLWDVVVTNPDGMSTMRAEALTIEEPRAPQLWVDVVGHLVVRVGQPATSYVLFGNRGNVDALGVYLGLTVPSSLALNLRFQITPPPPQQGQVPTDWSQVPINVQTDGKTTNILLVLPVVRAGSTGVLGITLTAGPELHGQTVGIITPIGLLYFNPDLDPQLVDDLVEGARAYARLQLGVTIPPELVPEMQRYLTNQLESVVARGRDALVASVGTQSQVYSIAQLFVDLAQFGAAIAGRRSQSIQEFMREASQRPSRASRQLEGFKSDQAEPQPMRRIVLRSGGSAIEPFVTRRLQSVAEDQQRTTVSADSLSLSGSLQYLAREALYRTYRTIVFLLGLLGPTEARAAASDAGLDCAALSLKQVTCPPCPVSGSTGGPSCCAKSMSDTECCPCTPVTPKDSIDPNDKVGSEGVTEAQFLSGEEPLRYIIFFENLATATLPAQVVVITDQLAVANMDLSTFSLGPIAFGDKEVIPPPGLSQFARDVDLRPATNLIVRIHADLDVDTGVLTWRFTSIDPATGQPTTDPVAGFLPPDVTPPEGQGSVLFTVKPKSDLATETQICNQASIVFDVNPAIATPQWCNTLDNTPPQSHVLPLAAVQTSTRFPVQWVGTDVGAGILDYTLFVSEDGGPFTPFLTNTTETSATFTGRPSKTYAFSSVARDRTGNLEEVPTTADTTTRIALVPGTLDIERAWVNRHPGANRDLFVVRGRLVLGGANNGLNVPREAVTVTFGGFRQTLPAGSFFHAGRTSYRYSASPGLRLVHIHDDGRFLILAASIDLSGLDLSSPVPFVLQIGDDLGETAIPFDERGRFWNRGEGRRGEDDEPRQNGVPLDSKD